MIFQPSFGRDLYGSQFDGDAVVVSLTPSTPYSLLHLVVCSPHRTDLHWITLHCSVRISNLGYQYPLAMTKTGKA